MNPHPSYMELAIAEAEKSRSTAAPNPWVGCVIVKDNKVVSKGRTIGPMHHQTGIHAEVNALRAAGDEAKGSDLYVTLEPCSHHGRTPPCTQAIIDAGIKRVFVAIQDPDPRVRGSGIRILREAGLHVSVGVEEKTAKDLLAPYLYAKTHEIPYTCLKVASSIDGCIAAKDQSSKWITGAASREKVHEIRAQSCAIMIGVDTAIADTPSLTVRDFHEEYTPPVRVILDTHGRLKAHGPLFDTNLAPTWIFTSEETQEQTVKEWESTGARVFRTPKNERGLNLLPILRTLHQNHILQLLVEGGGNLLGSFIREDLYQKLYLFIGAKFLGDGVRSFKGLDIPSMNFSHNVHLAGLSQLDKDVCLEYHHLSEIKELV